MRYHVSKPSNGTVPSPIAGIVRIVLRPATEADVPAILEILHEESVVPWWGEVSEEDVRGELEVSFVIEVDGEAGGWLLFYEETDPQYRHVSLDITLATRFQGRGLGRAALREAIDAFVARGHHRFTIDPAAANERAIRCYAAVGFKPVGVLRDYERGVDGTWHDGLLMDLLAREL